MPKNCASLEVIGATVEDQFMHSVACKVGVKMEMPFTPVNRSEMIRRVFPGT